MLGEQPRLFGPVTSIPTVWRSLNEIGASDIAAITGVRNRIRPKVWEAIAARHGAIPPAPTCYGDRVHARAEGFIRCGKDTGLGRWPSSSFAINTAWITAAALAIDLLCWMRLLLLDGPVTNAEPATLRHRLLHTAVRLISHSGYVILRICQTWPWAQEFADALNRALAIP